MSYSTYQSAPAVLMVRPRSFGFDEQTARTNAFQNEAVLPQPEVLRRANDEFNRMVDSLRAHDIYVHVYEDADPLPKPNAVFPNNWFSTWPDGKLFLYPMATESRRVERSQIAIDDLANHLRIEEIKDLSAAEAQHKYLESTGVLIFDHIAKVVYGCISERCNEQLFNEHAQLLGYEPVLFHAYDEAGTAIYHTNVMMGVQTSTVVICSESINASERPAVLARLKATGRTVVEISFAQMSAFCGNVLELRNNKGELFLAMSQSAFDNFTPEQRSALGEDKTLLPSAIPTIETIGGGSVRCMLGEIFLPPLV